MAGGLNKPTDLDFNPLKMGELWVTSQGDNSMTIIANATTAPMAQRRRDSAQGHFMSVPTGLAFGAPETTIMDASGAMVRGTFATCGDSRNGGDDFMGPVLWVSDLRIFAVPKAMREPPFNSARAGGLGSHIDMLHLSPLCTGIAWESANIYWTYSGISKAFVRYDFRSDHWIGNDDHTDGAIWRYTFPNQLGYLAGIPSHLVFRQSEKALYFADTANGRIVKFLPSSATEMSTMPNRDGLRMGPSQQFAGGTLTDVVAKGTLEKPSGLEINGETMFVTDNANGKIFKFAVTGGAPQGSVQTDVRPGGLGGITVGPDSKLYFVDMLGNRVLRLESGL